MTLTLNSTKYELRLAEWTPEKLDHLWRIMHSHGDLFSDLTRGNRESWESVLLSPDSIWFEVWGDDLLVGLIYFTGLLGSDAEANFMFLDRRTDNKLEVSREAISYVFTNFLGVHRVTIRFPLSIYHALQRMLYKLGFKREGCKRKSFLVANEWHDELIMGLLREERR